MIKKLESDPKRIFLIDGIGAVVTAFFLGVVLIKLERFFGIPSNILYLLAIIPIVYLVYDYYCYQKENHQIGPFLKGIAILNLMYCILSLGLAFYHQQSLTLLGWIYVIGEIIIIVVIAIVELKIANKLIQQYS